MSESFDVSAWRKAFSGWTNTSAPIDHRESVPAEHRDCRYMGYAAKDGAYLWHFPTDPAWRSGHEHLIGRTG
jgi:hypothetical protein